MKSKLIFKNADDHQIADCGEVLEIEFANHQLDWPGVVLDKGQLSTFLSEQCLHTLFLFRVGVR